RLGAGLASTETATPAALIISVGLRVTVPSATTTTASTPPKGEGAATEADFAPRVRDFLDQRLNGFPFIVPLDLESLAVIIHHALTEFRWINVSSALALLGGHWIGAQE